MFQVSGQVWPSGEDMSQSLAKYKEIGNLKHLQQHQVLQQPANRRRLHRVQRELHLQEAASKYHFKSCFRFSSQAPVPQI